MKIICIVFLLLAIFSCKLKGKENSQDLESAKVNITEDKNNDFPFDGNYLLVTHADELLDIDFNPVRMELVRFIDNDIIQNVRRIYREESDVIENINEIEPGVNVAEVLDKPFENREICIFSENSQNRLFNGIVELLNIFNMKITKSIIESFNSNDLYKTVKISIENLTLYVYREYNNSFKLFLVEYNDNYPYEPVLKIGSSKEEIINLLGTPSGYSNKRDLFIYDSQKTLRQVNIFFENNIVKHIQLISWGGV